MRQPCIYCGAKAEHLDHIIPISRGGLHKVGNLAPSCAKCNLSKSAKFVTEWRYR
jgi:5-methylcytosine-specific restriction endonuclease McrA